jgi:hypothetical protein
MRWAMNVSGISEQKNSYRVLGGKPDEKMAAWKIVRKWENSIERDLKDIEWEGGGGVCGLHLSGQRL